jgi:hypothetical protein
MRVNTPRLPPRGFLMVALTDLISFLLFDCTRIDEGSPLNVSRARVKILLYLLFFSAQRAELACLVAHFY